MKVAVSVDIDGTKNQIWERISDIENSVEMISGIKKIEVLERPDDGFIGFKWRETREMFGKEATEVMWITEAVENSFYQTRAESRGAIYISRLSIEETSTGCTLTMEFDGKPQTFGSKIMYGLTGFIFKSATVKALKQDLDDIKTAVEGSS